MQLMLTANEPMGNLPPSAACHMHQVMLWNTANPETHTPVHLTFV
jgi:hypothetical protein